jgi:hypothetical protein
VFEPESKPASVSGLVRPAPPPAPVDVPDGLPGVIGQFVKVITVVSEGVVAVGAGVITTVSDIIGQAVYLITGEKIDPTDATVRGQVTDFLQKLASGEGVSADAATSFENIIRQITGGTGVTGAGAVPAPLDFVQGAVDAAEELIETLAEWLQKIINAIIGR